MTKRKSFPREFKLEAVRLMQLGQKPASDLARELGVARNQLYKWRDELVQAGARDAFPGQGRQAGEAGEVARLQRELHQLREENEFLKKTARYFAKERS